jgi:hypothetical protein
MVKGEPIKGYKFVYLVFHGNGEDGEENLKLIGVFTTYDKARNAVKRVRNKPGFNDPAGKFHVNRNSVDRVAWLGGFS